MLRGERLILRALRDDDLARLWEFENDLELHLLAERLPPQPRALSRLRMEFEASLVHDRGTDVTFAIEADNQFIGTCELNHFEGADRTCKLRIVIGNPTYWGRGYGREAVRLLLDHAFRHLNVRKVWLTAAGNNERALRCYRACGFVEEGRQRRQVWTNGGYVDTVYMAIFREQRDSVDTE